MAAAQRDGATVVLADAEHTFNPAWAEVHGVDVGAVVQIQPETLEQFHKEATFIMKSGTVRGPLAIFLDSVANISTEYEKQHGEDLPAEHARLWSAWLREGTKVAAQRQALLVLVNQPRTNLGVKYGPNETSFGGRHLRHAYSLRLQVGYGKSITEDGVKGGRFMSVQAIKNKLAAPWRRATLRLDFETGFDDDWATLNHAKEMGCVAEAAAFIPKNVREARKNLGWDDAARSRGPGNGRAAS